jgi:hypothetical protein
MVYDRIIGFWTLSIARDSKYQKHGVSETGFCLLRQRLTLLGPNEYVPPGNGGRIQPSNFCILHRRQNDG